MPLSKELARCGSYYDYLAPKKKKKKNPKIKASVGFSVQLLFLFCTMQHLPGLSALRPGGGSALSFVRNNISHISFHLIDRLVVGDEFTPHQKCSNKYKHSSHLFVPSYLQWHIQNIPRPPFEFFFFF